MPGDRRSRRRPAGAALADTGGALRLLLAANPIPMWVYDLETLCFLEVNDAAVARYGYSRAELLAMTISDIRPAEDRVRLQASVVARRDVLQCSGSWRHKRSDGSILEVEVTSHLLEWAGRSAALVVATDVTESRRLQAELTHRTLFDDATGLPNAELFVDCTDVALSRSRYEGGHVGVLVVGLGGLEEMATAAGDQAVDAMVRAIAERLEACCGPQETLARLGDGRFAVLGESNDEDAMLHLGESVLAGLADPVAVPGRDGLRCRPFVGIALAGGQGVDDAPSLVRDAALAMRHAAERGEGHFAVFNAERRKSAFEAFETEQALRDAPKLGQLHLCYQPVIDLAGGEVVACEALLGWVRPGVGLVGPDRFIPLAERSELIVELGAWVIEHAIAEAASWAARTGTRPKVAVNLSARQLRDERLVERFASACSSSGLPPSSVEVELTESAFVATDDYGACRVLAGLREMGIEVAIDDFGTGYSSLSYLKHLPIDVIKIDRGFIVGLGIDRADSLLVEAVIKVAHGLELSVVAEGVETASQLAALRDLGCDAAQGYLLARPVWDADLPSAVERARKAASRSSSRMPEKLRRHERERS